MSAAVFGLSLLAAYTLPVTDFFKGLASIPAFGALVSALWQMWRDQVAHERAVELLNREQDFALTTASHMAEVAYDKHVLFCEEYVARVTQGIDDFYHDGSNVEALQFASDLVGIRKKHRTWLTNEIEESLLPFEAAVGKIGAGEQVLAHVPVGEQRTALVESIYRAFGIATGITEPETAEEQETTGTKVVEALRDVLGIRELTALRQETARVALARLRTPRDPGDS